MARGRDGDEDKGAKVVSLHGRGKKVSPPPPPSDTATVERAFAMMAARITEAQDAPAAQTAQLGIVQDLLKARSCYICQFVETRNQLRVATVRGRNDARIAVATPGEGPVGRSFSENRIVRDENLVSIPMGPADAPTGCVVILSARVAASDDLLRALSAQIVAASEVARLRDETTRRNKDLQTAVAGLKSIEHKRDEMLSNVSHDLKNPLTTIKTYLALLRQERLGGVTGKQRNALEACERNSERLLKLIEEMVMLSRLRVGEMELDERPFPLKELLTGAMEELTPAALHAGVAFNVLSASEVYVRGSKRHLREALENLLENAVDSTRTGTQIDVELVKADGALARLRITDRGVGLTEEELEHLFDGFRRFSRRRAGLGLPVAAKIFELHGGRISVETRPGEGTTLSVTLPIFAGPLSDASFSADAEPRDGGILLVEDDEDCREVLRELLEQEGYRVLTASTAASARALLGHIRPAMMLLDLRLSDDDGRTVLKYVRETETLKDLPVYVISGASDAAALLDAKGDERIDGFFEKPLQLGKMLPVLAQVARPSVGAATGSRG